MKTNPPIRRSRSPLWRRLSQQADQTSPAAHLAASDDLTGTHALTKADTIHVECLPRR